MGARVCVKGRRCSWHEGAREFGRCGEIQEHAWPRDLNARRACQLRRHVTRKQVTQGSWIEKEGVPKNVGFWLQPMRRFSQYWLVP